MPRPYGSCWLPDHGRRRPRRPSRQFSVAWADMNGDGYPDLAAGNKGPNRVYVNRERKKENTDVF